MAHPNNSLLWHRIYDLLPAEIRHVTAAPYLSGNLVGHKSVIQFFKPGDFLPSVVLKCTPSYRQGFDGLERESQLLSFLQSQRSQQGDLGFSVPSPLRSFEHSGWHYSMETAAVGHPLSELIFLRSRRQRPKILRNEVAACVRIAAKIPLALNESAPAQQIDASWYEIPDGIEMNAEQRAELRSEARKTQKAALCGHGDFTTENVFWDKATGRVSVIDWESPMKGVPRLYDAFTFLLSSLPALAFEVSEDRGDRKKLVLQFETALFGAGVWASATREILQCVDDGNTNFYFELLITLIIRTNYFLWRQSSCAEQYARLLQFAATHEDKFVAHRCKI